MAMVSCLRATATLFQFLLLCAVVNGFIPPARPHSAFLRSRPTFGKFSVHVRPTEYWEGDDLRRISRFRRRFRRRLPMQRPALLSLLAANMVMFGYQLITNVNMIRLRWPSYWPSHAFTIIWDCLWQTQIDGPLTRDFAHSIMRSWSQPHRYLTAGFLHGGLFHLLVNMDSLRQLPGWVETELGKRLYLTTFFGSIIAGNIAHTFVNTGHLDRVICLGASGGICGLYGLLYICLVKMKNNRAASQVAMRMLILFGYGVISPHVSNSGHVGGFLAGVASGVLFAPSYRQSYGARRKNSLEADSYSRGYRLAMGFGNAPSSRGRIPLSIFWLVTGAALVLFPYFHNIPHLILSGLLRPGSISIRTILCLAVLGNSRFGLTFTPELNSRRKSPLRGSRLAGIAEWRDSLFEFPGTGDDRRIGAESGPPPKEICILPFPFTDCLIQGETKQLRLYEERFIDLFETAMEQHSGVVAMGLLADSGIIQTVPVCEIEAYNRMEQFGIFVTIRAVGRATLDEIIQQEPYLKAVCREVEDRLPPNMELPNLVASNIESSMLLLSSMEHRLQTAKSDKSEKGGEEDTQNDKATDETMQTRLNVAKLDDRFYENVEDEEDDSDDLLDRRGRFHQAYQVAMETDTQGYRVVGNNPGDRTPQELTAVSWAAFCSELIPEDDTMFRIQAIDSDALFDRLKLASHMLQGKKAQIKKDMEKAGLKFREDPDEE